MSRFAASFDVEKWDIRGATRAGARAMGVRHQGVMKPRIGAASVSMRPVGAESGIETLWLLVNWSIVACKAGFRPMSRCNV